MQVTTRPTRTTTVAALLASTLILTACANPDDESEAAEVNAEMVVNARENGGQETSGQESSGEQDRGNRDESAGSGNDEAPEPPAAGEPLTQRAEFTDDVGLLIRSDVDGRDAEYVNLLNDASRFVVAEFVIEPGQKFPWHTHPGPVLINIAEADDDAFVFTFGEDCQERTYSQGEALIDPGGENVTTGSSNIHTARNDGDTDIRVIAVILGADAEDPLTIPAEPDEAAALDETCDVVTPRHGDGH